MNRIATAGALIALVGLAGGLRLVGHDTVLDGDRVHLVDPDSHYHARRMSRAAQSLPALPPQYDPLIAYPDRYAVAWPPAFDALGGVIARLVGARPDTDDVARVGTLLVVALGALTVLVVFALGRRLTGSTAWSLLGGFVIAVWPLHLEYSRVGRIDHHVLEPLLTAWALLLYLRATAAPTRWRRRRRSIACGLVIGTAFWTWPTALLPMGVIAAVMLADQIQSERAGLGPTAGRVVATAFATATVVVAPLAWRAPPELAWALHGPSFVHLLALALALATSVWTRTVLPRGWSRVVTGLAIVAFPVGIALIVAGVAPLDEALRLGGTFSARGGLWGMILEQRPLVTLRPLNIVLLLTYVGLALPVLIAIAMRRPATHAAGARELSLVVAATLVLGAAGLYQVRFLPLALVLAAPLVAVATAEVSRRVRLALQRHARPVILRGVPLASVGLLLIGLRPAAVFLEESINVPHERELAREAAARWLNRNPGPKTRPAVIAALGAGHAIVHLGRVPTVGSALIEPGTAAATRDTLEFFTARSDGELARARRIIDRRRVGRVLATRLPPRRYARYLAHLGRAAGDEVVLQKHRRCLATRLHVDSGSGAVLRGGSLAPIAWLRHTWEALGPFGAPLAQIFRRVVGARVQATVAAGAIAELTLPLLSPAGRPFVFRDQQRAGPDGVVVFRVPYPAETSKPTEPIQRYLRALSAYRRSRGRSRPALKRPLPPPLTVTTAIGAVEITSRGRTLSTLIPKAAARDGGTVVVGR